MRKIGAFLTVLALCIAPSAFAQEQAEPNVDELVVKYIEMLDKMLKLDDIQTFYIDSTLQHDYSHLMAEIDSVKKTGASQQETYMAVSDKWADRIDNALEKYLTEEQWQKYMKSPYGKEKKKREKRFEKMQAMRKSNQY